MHLEALKIFTANSWQGVHSKPWTKKFGSALNCQRSRVFIEEQKGPIVQKPPTSNKLDEAVERPNNKDSIKKQNSQILAINMKPITTLLVVPSYCFTKKCPWNPSRGFQMKQAVLAFWYSF